MNVDSFDDFDDKYKTYWDFIEEIYYLLYDKINKSIDAHKLSGWLTDYYGLWRELYQQKISPEKAINIFETRVLKYKL